jgi:3-deoxy-D-manno-octulosonic-acid transferase
MNEHPETFAGRIALALYAVVIHVVSVVSLPWLFLRAWKTGKLKEGLDERFGFLNRPWVREVSTKRPIWIHAVSVGEAQMLGPLSEALKRKFQDTPVVVSTSTVPGQRIAQSLSMVSGTFFLPLDLGWAVRKLVHRLKPRLLVVMETEIWPNLIAQSVRHGTPVVFMNGRISDHSYPGYRKGKWFLRHVLDLPSAFGVQSEKNAARFVEIGAPESKVHVVGNLKYESANQLRVKGSPLVRQDFGISEEALVLIGGSTFPGEEEMLIRIYEKCREEHPHLRLILAPRHPQRFEEAAQAVVESGHPLVRRSQGILPESSTDPPPVVLLDVMGELKNAYPLTDVVFMGKSMGFSKPGRGGQNPLEAAVWSRPILCGPLTENFRDVVTDLAEAGGIEIVTNEAMLLDRVRDLLGDPDLRRKRGEAAYSTIGKSLGAVDRCVAMVERVLR